MLKYREVKLRVLELSFDIFKSIPATSKTCKNGAVYLYMTFASSIKIQSNIARKFGLCYHGALFPAKLVRVFRREAEKLSIHDGSTQVILHSKNEQLFAILMRAGLNNVSLPILFTVANNVVQHCYTRFGLTNIVQYCCQPRRIWTAKHCSILYSHTNLHRVRRPL